MVAGYIIDYVATARRRRAGHPPVDRNKEMPHNFVLCHLLSRRVKWAFWLTNAPYWYLCWAVVRHQLARSLGAAEGGVPVWLECLRPVCGSSEVHGLCVFVIAAASTAFHGFQLEIDKNVAETCSRCCGCVRVVSVRSGVKSDGENDVLAFWTREKKKRRRPRFGSNREDLRACFADAHAREKKARRETFAVRRGVRQRVRRVSHDVRLGAGGGSCVCGAGGVHVRRRAGEAAREIQHVRGVPRAVAPGERVGHLRRVSVTKRFLFFNLFFGISPPLGRRDPRGRERS
jgi:hypothetical protein